MSNWESVVSASNPGIFELHFSLTSLLLVCCLAISIWLLRRQTHYVKPTSLPPGSMGIPFFGETLQFLLECSTGEFFTKRIKKYGPIFKTHLLGSPTVMIVGSENVKKILLGEHTLVTSIWPPSFRAVLGEGTLSMMNAQKHRLYRKVVLKLFRPDKMIPLVQQVQMIAKQEISTWNQEDSIQVYQKLKEITLRSACCVFLGVSQEDPELQNLSDDFGQLTRGLFTLPINFPGTGFYAALQARQRIHKTITAKMAGSHAHNSWGLLEYLMEFSAQDNLDLPPESVTSMAVELLFGGQETSASAMTCAILLLGKNKHVLQKLRKELSSNGLLESEADIDLITLESLTYLNNVMKEVLRICPPISGGYRKVLKTFEADGFTVPAGWNVTYSIKITHEMSSLFQDKRDCFDPDRWQHLKDNRIVNCNFLPFGAGPRACVGKEYGRLFFRVFLVELVRSFDWELLNEEPTMYTIPILQPADGLPTKFFKREKHGGNVSGCCNGHVKV